MIREACQSDMNDILCVVRDAVNYLRSHHVPQWQNGYPDEATLLSDIAKKTLHVYEHDGRVVGIANLSCELDPSYTIVYEGDWMTLYPNYLVVHRLAVKKEYLHQGIGLALLQYSETYALQHHKNSIRIDTHQVNHVMNRLLEKLGYVRCGWIHLVDYSESDAIRVAYEKILTNRV